jgi:pimeloyl-ACP methyl ester carboxylesterase
VRIGEITVIMSAEPATGYAPVNGAEVYWESRGSGGTPLVVVHGGYGTTSMFGDVLDLLARQRRVIAIELRGHGHTRDTSAPFSWAAFGDDVAGVIAHLGLGQADLLGYSLGGGAVLRCAIQHRGLVRKLVVVSAPCRRDAWFPEVLAGFDQMTSATLLDMLRQSPLYEAFAKVAPDPGSFPSLIDKTGELLRTPYDWSDEVRGLAIPVLLVYGDADSIAPSRASEFFALLGGGQRDAGWDGSLAPASRLAILPGTTHYTMGTSPRMADAVADFLD